MRKLKNPKEVKFRMTIQEREQLRDFLEINEITLQSLLHGYVKEVLNNPNAPVYSEVC